MQKGSYSEDLPHTRSRMTSPKKRIQNPTIPCATCDQVLEESSFLCWCNKDLHGSPPGIRSYAPPARTTSSGVGRNTHSWTAEIASEPTTAIHDHVAITSSLVETTRISWSGRAYPMERDGGHAIAERNTLTRIRSAPRTTATSSPARLSTRSRRVGRADRRGRDIQDAKIQGWR
jgi:hypothetical protein